MSAFDPNPTLGAVLIGTLLSTVLFGVTTMQTYMYYMHFPADAAMIKATVAFVWVCEAAHLGTVSHTTYTWLVLDYGHPERLLGPAPGSLAAFVLLTVIIAVCVQTFFSFRIYVLSRSRIIPYFTFALSSVRLGMGLAIFALNLLSSTLGEFNVKHQWLLLTTWSLSAVEDVTITVSLVYWLWAQKGSVHKQSEAFLDKIIMWTIETGLVTSMFTVVMLICFHAMPNNLVWMGLFAIEARLFANSLLASLNSRSVLRGIRNELSGSGNMLSFSNIHKHPNTYQERLAFSGNPELSVEMHTRQPSGKISAL